MAQIMPKTLRKVLIGLKEYNFSYSVITPSNSLMQGNLQTTNVYSKKTNVLALRKLCVFDQIKYGRASDQISMFMMCTFPRNFKVAVFYRRIIQIYDQITGQ